MKYLILGMLILIGCKYPGEHANELKKAKKVAEDYCSCYNGVYEIQVSERDGTEDRFVVFCVESPYRKSFTTEDYTIRYKEKVCEDQ